MALKNVPAYQYFSSLSTDSLSLLEKDANVGRVIVYYTDTQERVTWNGASWVDYSENGSFVLDTLGRPIFRVVNMAMSEQSTHDNLNMNANIQINDIDASTANPVPVNGVVSLSGSNTELLSKTSITWNGIKLTDNITVPSGTGKPILITIINAIDQAVDLTVTLEHQTEADVWIPYYQANGDILTWTILKNGGKGVFGIIQGFPRFLGGRIVLTGASAPTNTKITTVQVQEV